MCSTSKPLRLARNGMRWGAQLCPAAASTRRRCAACSTPRRCASCSTRCCRMSTADRRHRLQPPARQPARRGDDHHVVLDGAVGGVGAGADIRPWRRPLRKAVHAPITIDHIMASAALPLFFPAVSVDDAWYGDGGDPALRAALAGAAPRREPGAGDLDALRADGRGIRLAGHRRLSAAGAGARRAAQRRVSRSDRPGHAAPRAAERSARRACRTDGGTA
jgi:hypothetical protein